MGVLKMGFFALIKLLFGVGAAKIPKIGWLVCIALWAWMVSDILTIVKYYECTDTYGAEYCLEKHLN